MDFRILGPLEVFDDGRTLELGGARQRALLAILLLRRGEVVTADRLIEELYGERPPATAVKSLQVHMSRLRKALGRDGSLRTAAGGYALEIAPEQLDAERFVQLLDSGKRALARGESADAGLRFREALALWRGSPLSDLTYHAFARNEIARLEELRLAALEYRIEADLECGQHATVTAELDRLVAEHPLRERLREQLMLALYRSGRQAEALEAYQEARRVLVDELGIEPGRTLRELEQEILQQDRSLDVVSAGETLEASTGAFVGRDAELEALSSGLDAAIAGHGGLFLLVGEPGIGKSRLADEVIRRARARKVRVLVGRCWEAGGAPAYWPWVQSLRAYIRAVEPDALRVQLGGGASELAQILPELHEILPGLPEPTSLEPDGARFRLFDATAEFLRNASRRRPILLVLDDLHAADAPSLLLMQFITRQLGATRMLLIGAFRNVDPIPGQPLNAMLAEVTREPMTRRLSLAGLSEREVAEYLELTASEISSPELVAALHEETDGNPLFVGETVRLLALDGLQAQSTGARIAIPQSVRDVIARRLGHLSAECNRVLVLASVLGREFALSALARLGGVSEDELLETLDEAMVAGVVSEVPGGHGRLRFAHVLIRDTLYEELTTTRRVQLHRQTVAALEALYGDEPGLRLAELAHHAVAGSDFDKGLRFARRAADRALSLLAYEEAARLYGSALEALDHADITNEKEACELLLSCGEAEIRAGNSPAAKTAFLGAADIARRLGLSTQLARAALGYGGRIVSSRAGGDDRLVPLLEEGLAALSEGDVELRTRLLARLAGALRDEHSRDRRDMLSREAVELARGTDDPAALAYALAGRAAAIFAPDTVAERLALGSELRDVADRIGDRERVLQGHHFRFSAQLQIGDIHEAGIDFAAASRIADELRQPAQLWAVCAGRAMLALAAGRLDEAEELVPQALALGERAQPRMAIPAYQLQRYTLCDFRGRLEEVEPSIGELVTEYPARPVFRCALAYLYARLGRLPEARQALDDLARDDFSTLPFDVEWLYGMSLLAETCTLLSDRGAAAAMYELVIPFAAFNAVDAPEGTRGSVSRYLGLLATTQEHWSEAARHFDDAIAMNERMGARPWLAHTQYDNARMLLARDQPGDRELAQALLDRALASYSELSMETYAATARTLLLEAHA